MDPQLHEAPRMLFPANVNRYLIVRGSVQVARVYAYLATSSRSWHTYEQLHLESSLLLPL